MDTIKNSTDSTALDVSGTEDARVLDQQALQQRQRERDEVADRQRRSREWMSVAPARYEALHSVVTAIYSEVRELTKKRPEDPVTQFYVDQANLAIVAVKTFLREEQEIVGTGDEFTESLLDDVRIAVPAGDPLSRQDLQLIIRAAKAALERFRARHPHEWRNAGAY